MNNPSGSKRRIRNAGLAIVSAAVLTLGPWAFAQQPGALPSGPQPRAVRLSSVEGQVQLVQGNQILAAQALANTPLFEGTQISTSEDGRAEVQFEDGSVARVSPNSSLTLATLGLEGNVANTELVLNSGLGYFEIQGDSQTSHMRVHFGDSTVTASGFTVLRINLDYPPGEVAVFSGNVHLDSGNSLALDMHGGESVKLNGPDSGNYVLSEAIEPDSWDAWNSDRDQVLTAAETDRTPATSAVPNSNNPAWSDLDANGNWYNMPGQGYVWSPNEAASGSWDPYGCGSWMWTPNFGYMWVSCESWGYMPYAMGTWNFYDGLGWAWAPGLGVPWWGGLGWGFNIGIAPLRYRPPHRPIGGPRPGGPIRAGGRYQPYPVVAVNRVQSFPSGTPLRARNAPVTVAGNTLQPLRPMAPRPVYDHQSTLVMNRGAVPYGGSNTGVRYGFAAGSGAYAGHQGYWTGPTPSGAYRPAPHANSYYSAPHPSAPSHPSYGSGGATSHPSGGGGAAPHAGGGGGAHH
jgi:FecR protein